MPHCSANIAWFIGKFTIGFLGILFLYYGFLKEKDIECICAADARAQEREQNGKTKSEQNRCTCSRWQATMYPCGCTRNKKVTKNHSNISQKYNDTFANRECNCCEQ